MGDAVDAATRHSIEATVRFLPGFWRYRLTSRVRNTLIHGDAHSWNILMPMDETLAIAAVDLSGRAAFAVDTKVRTRLVGDLQTELVTDFFEGFARGARANIHVKTMYGRSNHHKIEAIFKAFARALRVACSRDKQLGQMLPSTKGLL